MEVYGTSTETVYGLAGFVRISTVKDFYALKGRPSRNPLIVHVLNAREAQCISHFIII